MTALYVTHDVKTTTFETRPKIAACAQKEAQQPQPLIFPRGTSLKQAQFRGVGNTDVDGNNL